MTLIQKIKDIITPFEYTARDKMSTAHREMFRNPVSDQEALQKRWNKPITKLTSTRKPCLISSMITIDNGKAYWHSSVRLVARSGGTTKPPQLWQKADRVAVRVILDNEFVDVGDTALAEYFYSVHASHIKVPLSDRELIEFARYHREDYEIKEDGKGITFTARESKRSRMARQAH